MTPGAVARLFRRPVPCVPTAVGYALWADTYPATPHNALMRAEQAVVAPMLSAHKPRRALDLGTGTGRLLPLIEATGARIAIGLDLSMPMLERHVSRRRRICADAATLPFADAKFDLVTSSLMVGDVDDLLAWMREVSRVLVPGGCLIYSDFHPSWASHEWRRTFTAADGRVLQIPYHAHDMDAHVAALDATSLEVVAIREPRLRPADAANLERRRRELPVVVVVHAVKADARYRVANR